MVMAVARGTVAREKAEAAAALAAAELRLLLASVAPVELEEFQT